MQSANGIAAFLTTHSPVYENSFGYFVGLLEKAGVGRIRLSLKSPLLYALQYSWLLVWSGHMLQGLEVCKKTPLIVWRFR